MQAISEETTIIKEIEKGKGKGTYSPQLHAFAFTAQKLIITFDKNKLAAPSTICSWYSNTNGSLGFTLE